MFSYFSPTSYCCHTVHPLITMATKAFTINSIYIALYVHSNDDMFHWCLVIPYKNSNAQLMHATNRQGGWHYESKDNNIFSSGTLCILVQIGNWPYSSHVIGFEFWFYRMCLLNRCHKTDRWAPISYSDGNSRGRQVCLASLQQSCMG